MNAPDEKTVIDIIKGHAEYSAEYLKKAENTSNSEFAWLHCRKHFHDAFYNRENADTDYLCLHLGYYLAIWGMLRNSFLMGYDHTVHLPVVEEVLNEKYRPLYEIDCRTFGNEELSLIIELKEFMKAYYAEKRSLISPDVKEGISHTLVTKIMLGTIGCVPAYDRYFTQGVKAAGITGSFAKRSLNQLVDFYNRNYDTLEELREKLTIKGVKYTQMKLIDMGFFEIGKRKDKGEL